MLSNPTNNLHNRQRQHRRQQSTPTAFEPVKAQLLPTLQRHGSHRRGMSLDTRRRQSPPQDLMTNHTNQGYTTTQQHILRETQQQRPIRPGPSPRYQSFDNDENYLQSPAVTPQRQSFDIRTQYAQQQQYAYPGQVNTTMEVNSYHGNNDFNMMNNGPIMAPSAYLDFPELENDTFNSQSNSRRSSAGRRISGGIVGRVAQFEQMAAKPNQRPATPPSQNASCFFPLTPSETPHHRTIKQEYINRRFLDSYDASMEETIKPRGNQRSRGVFEDMRREAEQTYPSPPNTRQMQSTSFATAPISSASFGTVNGLDMDFLKVEPQNMGMHFVPAEVSPALSYHTTPEVQDPGVVYQDPFVNKSFNEHSHLEHTSHMASSSPIDSYRRSESVSSVNIDEAVLDTGITIDDIAAYISGPDAVDGKWLCLYPECKKRFGRKENIKSHVQTHLGDRQYQCPHCNNRFVRQHDLKRHAKIHSGVKPYPCQCGNSFARHDALTRHRQRGMCIGAFEGVVKKTVKRGRPRKNRPDDEKRVEKSSKTRARNKDKAMSSSSSASGYSESSGGQSPRSDSDVLDNKPFADYASTASHNFQYSQPQSPLLGCVSPHAIQAHSPSVFSSHTMSRTSSHSRQNSISSPQHLPPLPASPTKSNHSYHSPPGLCESTSSPAASQYYELENEHNEEDLGKLSLANISEDDEMFLEAFANSGGMSGLDTDPNMLLEKFDESYNHGDDMFRDAADVFFGSP